MRTESRRSLPELDEDVAAGVELGSHARRDDAGSGACQPSQADEHLTRNLKEALALVDVKVLDHFIIAGTGALSFAERGLL